MKVNLLYLSLFLVKVSQTGYGVSTVVTDSALCTTECVDIGSVFC